MEQNNELTTLSLADYMLSATIACDYDLVIKLSKQGADNHAKCLSTAKKMFFANTDNKKLSKQQLIELDKIIKTLNEHIYKSKKENNYDGRTRIQICFRKDQ